MPLPKTTEDEIRSIALSTWEDVRDRAYPKGYLLWLIFRMVWIIYKRTTPH